MAEIVFIPLFLTFLRMIIDKIQVAFFLNSFILSIGPILAELKLVIFIVHVVVSMSPYIFSGKLFRCFFTSRREVYKQGCLSVIPSQKTMKALRN